MRKKVLAQVVPLLILAAATSAKVILSARELWKTSTDEKVKKAASSCKDVDASEGSE